MRTHHIRGFSIVQKHTSAGELNESKSKVIFSLNQNENTMSVEPTAHDVLSGLGAWLNQHPGNAHFRKIIEEQKSIYVAGTKKQKINISKAIVEAIYSKEPPGRFLKKCPETGQWKELSTKEAAEKVTQSMACAARGDSLKQQRKERHRRSRSRSLPSWTLPSPSFQPRGDTGTVSSQPSDQPTNKAGNVESFVNCHGCAVDTNAESAVGDGDGHNGSASNDLPFPGAFNRQQEPLLSSTNTALPTTSVAPLNVNQSGLAQVLAQAHQQQQLHDQQQQQQQQRVLGQLQLPATQQLSPASLHGLPQLLAHQQHQPLPLPNSHPPHIPVQISLGLPNSLPSSAPAASYPHTFAPSPAQPNDILLQSHSIEYYLMGSQPQSATSDLSQQPMQPQSQHHTNAHLLGMLDNVHQMDQVRCSLAQQQQQLLVLSLIASNQLLLQQQQQQQQYQQELQQQAAQQEYLHVNPLHQAWQTAPLRQNPNLNLQTINPPINTQPSVNAAASSSMKDDSEDE